MKSDSCPPTPDPRVSISTPGAEGQEDEWTGSETDGCESIRPLLTPNEESPARQFIKQEKKEKKKRRNKKIRKRFRRIVRTSWKWFRRGFAGLSPVANGMAMAFGPIVRQNSAHTTTVYGARP